MAENEYKRLGCSSQGCEKEHKALGLCQMHYRRLKRTGSPDTVARQCVKCGQQFHNQRKDAIYCTKTCKVAAWVESNADRFKELNLASAARVRERNAPLKAERMAKFKAELERMRALASQAKLLERKSSLALLHGVVPCPMCGKQCGYAGNGPPRRYCSADCADRSPEAVASRQAARAKRRALERGADGGDAIDPLKVFESAGWRCQICSKPTPQKLRGTYHKRAPELDHVVPLSKGGTHTWSNVQCSCRACNAWKSDRVVVGQASLFTALTAA